MKIFLPRIPTATPYNKMEFVSIWMLNYGGTYNNAVRVYQTALLV
jgi:hypothetical protein